MSSHVNCPWAQLSNCTSIIWYQTDQNLIPIILLSFWQEILKNLRSNPKRNLTSSDTACVIQKSIDQDVSCQWGSEKSQTVPEVVSIKLFPITWKNGVNKDSKLSGTKNKFLSTWLKVQSNLAIRNFLVALKLFLNAKKFLILMK